MRGLKRHHSALKRRRRTVAGPVPRRKPPANVTNYAQTLRARAERAEREAGTLSATNSPRPRRGYPRQRDRHSNRAAARSQPGQVTGQIHVKEGPAARGISAAGAFPCRPCPGAYRLVAVAKLSIPLLPRMPGEVSPGPGRPGVERAPTTSPWAAWDPAIAPSQRARRSSQLARPPHFQPFVTLAGRAPPGSATPRHRDDRHRLIRPQRSGRGRLARRIQRARPGGRRHADARRRLPRPGQRLVAAARVHHPGYPRRAHLADRDTYDPARTARRYGAPRGGPTHPRPRSIVVPRPAA